MPVVPFLSLLLLAPAPATTQMLLPTTVLDTVRQHEDTVDRDNQAEDVRIRTDDNERMTVAVRVSGSGPYRFLVDTGADRTAISSELASRLGLTVGDKAALHTMTGVSNVQTATVTGLQLSRNYMTILDAPVLEAEHMGADGILGTDSLRSQRVEFDFDNNVMTIVPSAQRVEKEDGTIVVTGRLRNGRLIVTNALADNNSITVVLDTGSEISVGNEALRRRLVNHGQLRNSGAVQLESVTGDLLNGQYMFVKRVEVGDVTLGNLAVVFADAHTFERLGLSDRPALLLGMNALRAFKKVSIDFASRKLRVILPESGGLDQLLLAAR